MKFSSLSTRAKRDSEQEATVVITTLPIIFILDLSESMKTQTPQKALIRKIEQILQEEQITNESINKLLENTAMLQQKLTYCIHLLLNPYFQPHNDLEVFSPTNNPHPFNTSDPWQIQYNESSTYDRQQCNNTLTTEQPVKNQHLPTT